MSNHLRSGKNVQFTAHFTDGITLIYKYNNGKLEHIGMLSTGTDTSYITTGKWPTKRSVASRTDKVTAWVDKNKKRYKVLRNKNPL